MKTCPPCHGDCNQGRDCPARQSISEVTTRFWLGLGWLIVGVIFGLLISKYSVSHSFELGYKTAFDKYSQYYPKQVKYFEEHRDRSCMLYWFNDSPTRVAEARRWMCQYTNKKGELK
jgi:hypothetical protein